MKTSRDKEMRVFVYRNLHKDCYSVKSLQTGRVVAHVKCIVLDNVSFKVSQTGRAKVLREKRKNVHAGVVGIWKRKSCTKPLKSRLAYNPYKYTSFVNRRSERPVFEAKRCVIRMDGVTI
jgi:hypothetical protein